jgi:predicted SAM-dependent methyltransferase
VSDDNPRPPFGERVKDKAARLTNRAVGRIRRRLAPRAMPWFGGGPIRLHLGCGPIDAPGFINVDLLEAPHIHVQRPLDDLSVIPDGSVDLVYACHCLEHFGYRHTRTVLQEWVRVLRPSGTLRISVPDFATLARAYVQGTPLGQVAGQILGGQDYRLNFHMAIFDEPHLSEMLRSVGLQNVRRWDPEAVDGHAFKDDSSAVFRSGSDWVPLSLNLEADKK